MTLRERRYPALIKGSRRQRIAKGAGLDIQELNRLMKQFEKMQLMMKGGMKKMMQRMQQMQGMMGKGFPQR